MNKPQPESLMRTYLEQAVDHGRLELGEATFHADIVDEANQAFGDPPVRAGLVARVKGLHRAVGELQVTVDRIVAANDAVMAWWSFGGLHVAPWLGWPPTGNAIRGTVFSLFDVVGGHIGPVSAFSPCRVSRICHLGSGASRLNSSSSPWRGVKTRSGRRLHLQSQ